MTTRSPEHIGPYTITRELGRGGMGVVYLASDTRLDRQVAIKALPEHLAADPDRLGRFEREARTLASLNHPNVAAIYGVEEQDGRKYLVLEYVEGQTLAERLDRGALPVDEALEVCTQIAAGVEAAHEAGVIHRDLKPANVKITPEGKVKVLDFGLAKVAEGASSSGFHEAETVTSPAHRQHSPTVPGVILGTAAYMSPEQARGRAIDKRTDIWSFGVVLYECVLGRRPFEGETLSDLIARILEREPDWSILPPSTPPLIQLLLRRCLAKDRNRRLRDIGDARVEMESALGDPTSSTLFLARGALADSDARRRVWGTVLAIAMVISAGLGAFLAMRVANAKRDSAEQAVIRFSIDFPESEGLELAMGDGVRVALNRAGTVLAFTASEDNTRRIFLRPINSRDARPLPGTEGGSHPVFSPDGRWVGFKSGGRLMKVPVSGGPALTIADKVTETFAWLDGGSVVFTSERGDSIQRVDSRGGPPKLLAKSDRTGRVPGREQVVLGFDTLHAVPDAPYILAAVWDGNTIEDYDVVSVSLEDGSVRQVVANANQPQFVAPDSLLFHREGSIFAVPFDLKRGAVTGEAALVLAGVRTAYWGEAAQCAVSLTGTLAYVPGARMGPGRRLIRVNSAGRSEPMMDKAEPIIGGLRVSPDESAVAILTLRRHIELWSFDLSRRTFTLVEDTGESYAPVWFPNGNEIAYKRLGGEPKKAVLRRRVDSREEAEVLVPGDAGDLQPTSVSPDGKFLLMTQEHSPNQRNENIVVLDLETADSPRPLVATAAYEGEAVFSPNGKWIAYTSNETGRFQIYVRPFPDGGRRWQVSTDGGFAPRWSRDGAKVFFIHDDAVHASGISTEGGFSAEPPEKLFDAKQTASLIAWGSFDVLSSGEFIMVEPAEWEKTPPRIEVVVNWIAELRTP